MGEQAGVADRVGELLAGCADVGRALAGLPSADPDDAPTRSDGTGAWQVGDADLVAACRGLLHLRSAVEAAYLAAVAEVDRRRAASSELLSGSTLRRDDAAADVGTSPGGLAASGVGASTEKYLLLSAPLGPGQARADVAAARATAPGEVLHGLAARLADGEVTRAHVDVAVRCLDTVPTHLRSEPADRRVLTEFFTTLAPEGTPRQLRSACRALLERLAPDRVHRFDPMAHQRRFLDISDDSTGMCVGSFALDAAAGAVVRKALEGFAAPRPAVTREDDALLGDCVVVRDERTPRQRRADGLVELAQAALGVSGRARGERPRVVVHTTAEQLADVPPPLALRGDAPLPLPTGRATTSTGQDLDWFSLRRLSCDAVLQRVVWDRTGNPLHPELLELGRTSRLADVHLRRALEARDRGCLGCGAPAAACDVHHVVHWADGGPTGVGNTVLLCGSCHTAVHLGHLELTMTASGHPLVRRLDARDRTRRARAPHHHYLEQLVRRLRGAPPRVPSAAEHDVAVRARAPAAQEHSGVPV